MVWTLLQSKLAATWAKCVFGVNAKSNGPDQLAEIQSCIVWSRALLYFLMSCSTLWFCKRTPKVLIRLRACAGWSGPLLSAYVRRRFRVAWPKWKPMFYAICEKQRNRTDCCLANANTVRYLEFIMNGILYEQRKSWPIRDRMSSATILLFRFMGNTGAYKTYESHDPAVTVIKKSDTGISLTNERLCYM